MPSALGLVVGPIGYRPSHGFFIIFQQHHLHLHPAVSRLSINSHIQAISASPPTNHTAPERGQRLDSSGDDKDKYGEKDKDINEESLPVFISLGTLSSNE